MLWLLNIKKKKNKIKKNFKERIKYVFNRLNFSKVLVIFVVGFVTRVLINYVYDINVFVDYLNTISLTYYGMMSIFIVLVNELFTYFEFKLLPKISLFPSITVQVFNVEIKKKCWYTILN